MNDQDMLLVCHDFFFFYQFHYVSLINVFSFCFQNLQTNKTIFWTHWISTFSENPRLENENGKDNFLKS